MVSKNNLANEMYGYDFEDCSPGEKAAVTRAYNNQSHPAPSAGRVAAVSVEIGRIGVNGTKKCLMTPGQTVEALLKQAGLPFDAKKEGIIEQASGASVDLRDTVKSGVIYVITPEIKSA